MACPWLYRGVARWLSTRCFRMLPLILNNRPSKMGFPQTVTSTLFWWAPGAVKIFFSRISPILQPSGSGWGCHRITHAEPNLTDDELVYNNYTVIRKRNTGSDWQRNTVLHIIASKPEPTADRLSATRSYHSLPPRRYTDLQNVLFLKYRNIAKPVFLFSLPRKSESHCGPAIRSTKLSFIVQAV